jgi:hypothetical protein
MNKTITNHMQCQSHLHIVACMSDRGLNLPCTAFDSQPPLMERTTSGIRLAMFLSQSLRLTWNTYIRCLRTLCDLTAIESLPSIRPTSLGNAELVSRIKCSGIVIDIFPAMHGVSGVMRAPHQSRPSPDSAGCNKAAIQNDCGRGGRHDPRPLLQRGLL